MTPYERAKAFYRKHLSAYSIEEDIRITMNSGYIISTPEVFIMGRQDGDTWTIFLYVGDLAKVLSFIPFPLRWVEFGRNGGPLKRYDFAKLTRKINGKLSKTIRAQGAEDQDAEDARCG